MGPEGQDRGGNEVSGCAQRTTYDRQNYPRHTPGPVECETLSRASLPNDGTNPKCRSFGPGLQRIVARPSSAASTRRLLAVPAAGWPVGGNGVSDRFFSSRHRNTIGGPLGWGWGVGTNRGLCGFFLSGKAKQSKRCFGKVDKEPMVVERILACGHGVAHG